MAARSRKAFDAAAIASAIGTMVNSLDVEGRPQDVRVGVAMSGGVDSSATAALLKSEGYDVVGITLQLYDHGAATHRKGACCAGQDIHDARNVAERIGIPHYVLDYESRFRESVIDNFADSYASGETPVPCIECNRSIKFRDLLKTARELGAQALATGHYVASRPLADGSRALHCAADADRDQSYFLFATTREQLDYLRFPLGDMTKPQARELARRFDLAAGEGLEIFVRVRSTRAPQPAWLRAANSGYEIELVAGEEGVSPGQACVFYDAPSGQARVLGGGFIQSATAKGAAAMGAMRPRPLVEAVRG